MTGNVVAAIQEIVATIGEMSEIAAEVAAAVGQQRVATREIAQNAPAGIDQRAGGGARDHKCRGSIRNHQN